MLEALLIAAVGVGVLSCPVMMWLGRRGIGPGCAMPGCADERQESLAALRRRQGELEEEIARLESPEQEPARAR